MTMHLSSVFPAEPLRAKFSQSVLIEQWDKSQLAKIATLKKESIFEIGAGAWDRYVASNEDCDPQALSKYFQEQDSRLYLAMERQIRSKVLIDISYTLATVEDDAPLSKCVGELLLAIVSKFFAETGSKIADSLMKDWQKSLTRFTRVMPRDYARILKVISSAKSSGKSVDSAIIEVLNG